MVCKDAGSIQKYRKSCQEALRLDLFGPTTEKNEPFQKNTAGETPNLLLSFSI
jgi:hypothetical protein